MDPTITFPLAYTNSNYIICQAEIGAAGAHAFYNGYAFINTTLTSVVCSMRNDAYKTCSWLTLGY